MMNSLIKFQNLFLPSAIQFLRSQPVLYAMVYVHAQLLVLVQAVATMEMHAQTISVELEPTTQTPSLLKLKGSVSTSQLILNALPISQIRALLDHVTQNLDASTLLLQDQAAFHQTPSVQHTSV